MKYKLLTPKSKYYCDYVSSRDRVDQCIRKTSTFQPVELMLQLLRISRLCIGILMLKIYCHLYCLHYVSSCDWVDQCIRETESTFQLVEVNA